LGQAIAKAKEQIAVAQARREETEELDVLAKQILEMLRANSTM
jgi:hypothetical protein